MKTMSVRTIAGVVMVPLLLLWAGATPGPATAFAQNAEPNEPPEILDQNLSADERAALLARLSDEQVRAKMWDLINISK